MTSATRLGQLLPPAASVPLTVECQEGVVGAGRALPELARRARDPVRSPTSPGW